MKIRAAIQISTGLFSLTLAVVLIGCGGSGSGSAGGFTIQSAWEGTKQAGTTSFDFGWGNTVDKNGNVFVTGGTGGSLDGNTSAGDLDMILVKYNAAGEKQWTRQLGTAAEDTGNAVAVDASGNIYVVGTTLGDLGGPHEGNADEYDIFLVKYNTEGTEQWRRRLGTPEVDDAPCVAVDDTGNIYVSGTTYGDMDGDLGGTNAGNFDIFLVKYNAAGEKQWTRQLGTEYSDECYSIAVDTNGNIYMTGLTYGNLDGKIMAGGNFDVFLVKYNAAGEKQWTELLGTPSDEYGYGVATDAGGNVYVTGVTSGHLEGTNAGGTDMFLAKYNTSGVKQWTRQLGTTSDDDGWGVAVDANGNIFVAGDTYGALEENTSAGDWDAFLVKYNTSGTRQWIRQFGTDSEDVAYGVKTDSGGNAFVTGYTFGGLDGNINAGEDDIFLVKYNTDGAKQ